MIFNRLSHLIICFAVLAAANFAATQIVPANIFIEAEEYSSQIDSDKLERVDEHFWIGGWQNGDWLAYKQIDFGIAATYSKISTIPAS